MAKKGVYLGILMFFFALDASAARCQNISIKYSFPAQIDVTNKKVGDQLYTFGAPGVPLTLAGQCLRASSGAGNTTGNFIYIVDKYGASPNDCPNGGTVDKNSSDGILRFRSTGSCSNSAWILVLDYKTSGTGYTNLANAGGGTDSGTVYLQKIPPVGKTVVNPTYMLTKKFYSRIGNNSRTLMSESVAFSAPTSMTLVNNASCAVSVNDVDFGNQTASSVNAKSVAGKTINVAFTCNAVLPAYTLSFSGKDGVNNAANGIINVKSNPSVGYQFTWGNSAFKPVNSAVVINGAAIAPNTKPTTANFTIPITVKPVPLTTQTAVGAANTALTINVKLN
ncbi:fimbrial protein [Providencia sp. wls1914]|uniref:fimbrial protein n=1 Tax=Providencia sp. wls1914 TaxID=2675156 RepID=UPI0012B56390|nr:fimbrial protein [Providencia sp. wls1914]MTC69465.1 fimbrial protein [Providencia sp. wls1914]MTC73058.1 fimbrial protein [Providencia sp. wls1919]